MTATKTAKRIDLGWVVVNDLDDAIKFYTETVGLELKNHEPMFGWAELQGGEGGAKLGLAEANDGMGMIAGENAVMTFVVDDIEASRADFEGQGVQLEGEVIEIPGHIKLQTFLDSSGNKFQIVEKLG